MIFDKKLGGFRIVPINQHYYFEKQKNVIIAPPQQIRNPVVQKPTLFHQIPQKKKNGKNFIKDFKAKIKSHNAGFVGGSKQEGQKKGPKKLFKSFNEDKDSTGLVGGSEGNEEFEQQ
jgi:hypothetical protein